MVIGFTRKSCYDNFKSVVHVDKRILYPRAEASLLNPDPLIFFVEVYDDENFK
jgi:hypothetical protein